MVRNDELIELSATTKEISKVIRDLAESKGYTQTSIAASLKKAQSYVSLRFKGLKAWNIEELQHLALLLHFKDIFDFFDYIKEHVSRANTTTSSDDSAHIPVDDDVPLTADGEVDYTELTRRFDPEELGLAAYRDPNKYIESQTPTE